MSNQYDQITGDELSSTESLVKAVLSNNVHTAILAEIQSFDSATQTCEAQPVSQMTMGNGESRNYPLCVDIPVQFVGGADFHITHPVKKGDECLLVFNERSIDNWFSNGGVQPENELRRYDMSDACAIVGFRNLKTVITDFNNDAIELRNKTNDTKIQIKNDEINIIRQSTNIKVTSSSIVFSFGGYSLVLNEDGITTNAPINSTQDISSTTAIEATTSLKVGGKEMSMHTHAYTDNGNPMLTGVPT